MVSAQLKTKTSSAFENPESVKQSRQGRYASCVNSPQGLRQPGNSMFDPKSLRFSNGPETGAQRQTRLKDEFRKNFVDINFYGMQTKVQNPMSSPNWTYSPTQSMNADPETMNQLPIKQKLHQMEMQMSTLNPAQEDYSPAAREKMKNELINRFKVNVNTLKDNLNNATD